MKNILDALQDAQQLLNNFMAENKNLLIINEIAKELVTCFNNGNKIIICGNGGSSADAVHFAEELTGKFREERPALPAIALNDSSFITCVANDFGFDEIFARGVQAFGKEGDVLITLSTSGNSNNVIRAIDEAEKLKMKTVAFLGKDGGKLLNRCFYQLVIPGTTSDRIQEIHMLILHILVEQIERTKFPENYQPK